MGCDMSVLVEAKKNGVWKDANLYTLSRFTDATGVEQKKFYPYSFYGGRNYVLYAILANVRNCFGLTPISEPRGIPEDCCEAILDCFGGKREVEGLVASWLTLTELRNARKNYWELSLERRLGAEGKSVDALDAFVQQLENHLENVGINVDCGYEPDDAFTTKPDDIRVIVSFFG